MSKSNPFKHWQGDSGRWYWHLKARNGRIICAGQPRGYASERNALKGIEAVHRAVGKVEFQILLPALDGTQEPKP